MTRREEQAEQARQQAEMWIFRGNNASDRGDQALAERHYERAQKHMDRMNRLLGNGDGGGA